MIAMKNTHRICILVLLFAFLLVAGCPSANNSASESQPKQDLEVMVDGKDVHTDDEDAYAEEAVPFLLADLEK